MRSSCDRVVASASADKVRAVHPRIRYDAVQFSRLLGGNVIKFQQHLDELLETQALGQLDGATCAL